MDWGLVAIEPLFGTLPDDFPDETIHLAIDRARKVMVWSWGAELALDPFFCIMAVAPPKAWGRCISDAPRSFGGNMDKGA